MDYWKQYANTGGDGSRTGKKKPRQANPAGIGINKRKRRVGRVSFAKIGNLSDCAQNSGKTPENGQIRGVSDCLPFRTQPRGVPGSKSANGTGAPQPARHDTGARQILRRARAGFSAFSRAFPGAWSCNRAALEILAPLPPGGCIGSGAAVVLNT